LLLATASWQSFIADSLTEEVSSPDLIACGWPFGQPRHVFSVKPTDPSRAKFLELGCDHAFFRL
jgi:hypothetical protein